MSDIFNFFPLTIYKSKIGLGHNERSLLIDEVYNLEKNSDKLKSNNKAWTGDTQVTNFFMKMINLRIYLLSLKNILKNI